jgi:hypothetical protein
MRIARTAVLLLTAASLAACSSIETLQANCRARLAAAPQLTTVGEPGTADEHAAPTDGAVTMCVKESAAAEASARQTVGLVALVVLTAGAVALAVSSRPSYSRPTYHRPTYYGRRR